MSQRILIIDDSAFYRNLVNQLLVTMFPDARVTEYDPVALGNPGPGYNWGDHDILILDHQLGEETGLQWLQEFGGDKSFPVTIFLTGEGNESVAVKAMKLGVKDYISKKDLTPQRLREAIDSAIETRDSGQYEALQEPNANDWNNSDTIQRPQATPMLAPFTDEEILNGKAIVMGYKINKEIGAGGMSTVYQATRIEDELTVAIKILAPHLNNNDRYLDRFIEEYNIASNLDHDNIVKIYEQGFTDKFSFIAMEHLPNGDLKNKMIRGIASSDAIGYAINIASSLHTLHGANIIHRDLKPSNILFNKDDHLVLVDFGVVKQIDNDLELTRHGETIGTPAFMSPEQILNHPFDTRSDLYALGVLLYMMLTGKRLFHGQSAAAILYKQVHEPVPDMPNQSADLKQIVNKLLAKSPEDRYQTANELCDDLKAVTLH